MNINKLLELYPEIAPVLTYEYGLYCVNCIISDFDTLENGAEIHGFSKDDLSGMINHLELVINQDEEST